MFMDFFAPKRLSCGVLVLNAERELLLCHVTGHHHWDLPKGGIAAGETPREAALRETHEETSLRLVADDLLDLGRFAYRPRKDLHLFAVLSERFDAALCHCDGHYIDHWGRDRPEMDNFEWTAFDRVQRRCARHMAEVLASHLSLPALLGRLRDGPGSAV